MDYENMALKDKDIVRSFKATIFGFTIIGLLLVSYYYYNGYVIRIGNIVFEQTLIVFILMILISMLAYLVPNKITLLLNLPLSGIGIAAYESLLLKVEEGTNVINKTWFQVSKKYESVENGVAALKVIQQEQIKVDKNIVQMPEEILQKLYLKIEEQVGYPLKEDLINGYEECKIVVQANKQITNSLLKSFENFLYDYRIVIFISLVVGVGLMWYFSKVEINELKSEIQQLNIKCTALEKDSIFVKDYIEYLANKSAEFDKKMLNLDCKDVVLFKEIVERHFKIDLHLRDLYDKFLTL